MMVTNITHPELDEDTKRDPSVIYINHTKGFWLRHNKETEEIELWFDGQFHVSWNDAHLTHTDSTTSVDHHVVNGMLKYAFELGKKQRSAEFNKLLGR